MGEQAAAAYPTEDQAIDAPLNTPRSTPSLLHYDYVVFRKAWDYDQNRLMITFVFVETY